VVAVWHAMTAMAAVCGGVQLLYPWVTAMTGYSIFNFVCFVPSALGKARGEIESER